MAIPLNGTHSFTAFQVQQAKNCQRQRALSASAMPDQTQYFAWMQFQMQIVQDGWLVLVADRQSDRKKIHKFLACQRQGLHVPERLRAKYAWLGILDRWRNRHQRVFVNQIDEWFLLPGNLLYAVPVLLALMLIA